MTVVQGMRFANTFYDITNIATSVPDEMLITKEGAETGRLFYKDKQGNLIDLFDKFASQIKADEIQSLLDDVLEKAKEYTDDTVVDVNGGQLKIARYVYLLRAAEGQTIFNIPLSTFDKDEDFMMFTTNTVMPDEGFTITNSSIIFDEGLKEGTTVRIFIIKNIPVGEEGTVNASILKPGTITEDLLDPAFLQKLYAMIQAGGGGTVDPDPDPPVDPDPDPPVDPDPDPPVDPKPPVDSDTIKDVEYEDSTVSSTPPVGATMDTWIQLETPNASLEGVAGDMIISETQPVDDTAKIWFKPVE